MRRLDLVFAALNERGIVALQNAGYMQDDGYDEVWESYPDAADDEHTIGYCFYHKQDMYGGTSTRHQLNHPGKIQHASQYQPVTYVVFDLLAHHGRSLIGQPLHKRRALLQDVLARLQEPRVPFSEGIVGSGRVFIEQAVRQSQEWVMAKHLASRYLPGKLSSCWLKIKPSRRMPCVIIGWEPGVCGLRGLFGGGAVGRPVALRGQSAHCIY